MLFHCHHPAFVCVGIFYFDCSAHTIAKLKTTKVWVYSRAIISPHHPLVLFLFFSVQVLSFLPPASTRFSSPLSPYLCHVLPCWHRGTKADPTGRLRRTLLSLCLCVCLYLFLTQTDKPHTHYLLVIGSQQPLIQKGLTLNMQLFSSFLLLFCSIISHFIFLLFSFFLSFPSLALPFSLFALWACGTALSSALSTHYNIIF